MDAIHINWTKPFRNRFNAPYEVEDFEILTTILSALKWREKNGNIKMVTDSVGAQYYKKTGLDVIWNSVENIIDNALIPMKAVLGTSKINVQDFVNLQLGDVIRLDRKVDAARYSS